MATRPNSFERQVGLSSQQVEIVGNNQDISAHTATTGGIEVDTERVIRTEELDNMQFMRDTLEVMFSEPQNENEPRFVEVNVNGDYVMAVRDGTPCKLRRYHVAVLAQAKQMRVRQEKTVQPDGSMGYKETAVLALSYPFQVMMDPNPNKGVPWLRQLLANPV